MTVEIRLNPNLKAEVLKATEEKLGAIAQKVFDIAQSKPKGEGVTLEELVDAGLGSTEEIKVVLAILENQGRLQSGPLFYWPTQE
jgi:hypothetical protein